MYAITSLAAVIAIVIGIGVIWANPLRLTNQVFALTTIVVAGYLLFLARAISATAYYESGYAIDAVPLIRSASAVIMFVPWSLWILKESLVQQGGRVLVLLWRSGPIFVCCCGGAILCFTDAYIPSNALPNEIKRGSGHLVNVLGAVAICGYVAAHTWIQMRRQKGIRRIELQFLVWNSSIAVIFAGGLSYYAYYGQLPILRRFIPVVIIINYALAAWAFAYYRIFDVRQVCLSVIGRSGLILLLGIGSYLATWHGLGFESPLVAAVVSFTLCASLLLILDRYVGDLLGVSPKSVLADMRNAVINIARAETDPDQIVVKFCRLLRDECKCKTAALLVEEGGLYLSSKMVLRKLSKECAALSDCGWATPESLLRRRPSDGLRDLSAFLAEHDLGLLVASPQGSKSPTLLIALGVKVNEWPFTYPEVERLLNIAELMDNILTRSRLTMQAALRAKVEHLAMMSRGLAHDLNNLITPVSSFLVHTETYFPPDSPEREVHRAASSSVRMMADYVREALFFSNKLTPRIESATLAGLFRDVREVTAVRAGARGVQVVGEPEFGGPVMIDAVLIQRVLVNLVHNAIDASPRGRAVTLAATADREGWFRLEVADSGSGIPPEIAGRIFDPYFTTKQFGEDIRGFGLGLTISQKIVQLHNGNITVRSPPGAGTVIWVDLPIASSN